MAILRWIHLRKLVPLTELIQGLEAGTPRAGSTTASTLPRSVPSCCAAGGRRTGAGPARPPQPRSPVAADATVNSIKARSERAAPASSNGDPTPAVQSVAAGDLKDALLNEIKKSKKYFYGTVVAQAQRIDIDGDRVVFTFAPNHRPLRLQLDQSRTWLDGLVSQLAGRKMTVASAEGSAVSSQSGPLLTEAPGNRRKRIASPISVNRHSPTRASRPCSTSLQRRSKMWKRESSIASRPEARSQKPEARSQKPTN